MQPKIQIEINKIGVESFMNQIEKPCTESKQKLDREWREMMNA